MISKVYSFGAFRLDLSERALRSGEKALSLTPKAMEILIALVESGGRLMTKEELLAKAWPDTFVEEGNLTFQISVIRKTLDAEPGAEPAVYIETVPRRGYRFVAPIAVTEPAAVESVEASSPEAVAETRLPRLRLVWLVAAAVIAIAAVGWSLAGRRTAGTTIRTLAILPFAALGDASGSGPLAVGVPDAIIRRLAGLSELTVRPTNSVLGFGGAGRDPIQAGKSLRVDAVLTGTIQQTHDEIRVAAQLLRVSDGRQIWSGQFDRPVPDLLSIEDSVSANIADALRLKLSDRERQIIAKRSTNNAEAYRLYLTGQYHLYRWTADSAVTAAQYFERAIQQDPDYALAQVGLVNIRAVESHFGLMGPRTACATARQTLDRAIQLDPDMAEARIASGMLALHYEWNRVTAEKEMAMAVKLGPNLPEAHTAMAALLTVMGKPDLEERQKALDLDPPSANFTTGVGWSYFYSRRYDEANRFYREAMAKDPSYAAAWWSLGESLEQQGRLDDAIAAFEKSAALTNRSPRALAGLGHCYGLAGRRPEALAIADQLQRGSSTAYVPAYFVALVYLGLGDRDRAFEWLERAFRERSDWLAWIHVHPHFDAVRTDPRFRSLEDRIGLWKP